MPDEAADLTLCHSVSTDPSPSRSRSGTGSGAVFDDEFVSDRLGKRASDRSEAVKSDTLGALGEAMARGASSEADTTVGGDGIDVDDRRAPGQVGAVAAGSQPVDPTGERASTGGHGAGDSSGSLDTGLRSTARLNDQLDNGRDGGDHGDVSFDGGEDRPAADDGVTGSSSSSSSESSGNNLGLDGDNDGNGALEADRLPSRPTTGHCGGSDSAETETPEAACLPFRSSSSLLESLSEDSSVT